MLLGLQYLIYNAFSTSNYHRLLNSFTNMVAKIDINAFKFKKKSKTNETENRLKIKNSQSQLKICRSYKKRECIYAYYFIVEYH